MATTYEVHLAVYDLSRGMARSLSGQFLGANHAIEIIPHTGLVVYGREYFFGGGIQSESPQLFRQATGMFPISQELLGHTTVSQEEFEAWCRNCMARGKYTMEDYDLLERNCNNFSHEAAVEGLRLPRGVPEWILDIPRRFLASPMGQMVRPMLEGMQVTGGHEGGSSSAPFAHAAPSITPAPTTTASAAASNNPWAHLPSSNNTASNTTSLNAATPTTIKKQVKTPVLDTYTHPLLSNDAKTATVCANKLTASTDDDHDKQVLEEIARVLVSGETPSDTLVETCSKAILLQLQAGDNVTFALLLFRLVVLHPPTTMNGETSSAFCKCLEWIHSSLSSTTNTNTALTTPASKSAAWCVLSNAYGSCPKTMESMLETSFEAAMRDLSIDTSSPPVRQAAAAFLYNVSVQQQQQQQDDATTDDGLSDTMVSLLCASLDGVNLETDSTSQLRRLVSAANICKSNGQAATSLVNDLGFCEVICEIVAGAKPNASGNDQKVQQVATEFLLILE